MHLPRFGQRLCVLDCSFGAFAQRYFARFGGKVDSKKLTRSLEEPAQTLKLLEPCLDRRFQLLRIIAHQSQFERGIKRSDRLTQLMKEAFGKVLRWKRR